MTLGSTWYVRARARSAATSRYCAANPGISPRASAATPDRPIRSAVGPNLPHPRRFFSPYRSPGTVMPPPAPALAPGAAPLSCSLVAGMDRDSDQCRSEGKRREVAVDEADQVSHHRRRRRDGSAGIHDDPYAESLLTGRPAAIHRLEHGEVSPDQAEREDNHRGR